jgi:hypothetical protein
MSKIDDESLEEGEIASEGLDSIEELALSEASLDVADDEDSDLWQSLTPRVVLDSAEQDDESDLSLLPAQADEFTCSSCFLILNRVLLANADKNRCRDCN